MPDVEALREIRDMPLWDKRQEAALKEAVELMEILDKDPFALMVEHQRQLPPEHPAILASVDE